MTVRVNGAVDVTPFTESCRPVGVVAKLSVTVCGSRRTDVVPLTPPPSVAVSWSSRYDGYSWSGAVNEPFATPGQLWIVCEWQFDGQCWIVSDQESREAASVPSSGSVADPLNEIASPTFQCGSLAVGVAITGCGGAFAGAAPLQLAFATALPLFS